MSVEKSDCVLPECYGETYKKMLKALATETPERYKKRSLTAFWPMKGKLYKEGEGLMVIGRAVNGWSVKGQPTDCTGKGWTAKELELERKIEHLVLGIRRLSEDSSRDRWKISPDNEVNIRPKLEIQHSEYDCPLSWVAEKSGSKNGGYNTNLSAFWRVNREILEALYPCKVSEEQWSSHLCWSNLYKVAPLKTGNPLKSSRDVQKQYCTKLLEIELEVYAPKYVLVVAGNEWYEPFVNCLGIEADEAVKDKLVEKSGRLGDQTWVFAKHPQGKSQECFVSEVNKTFKKIKTS